MNLSTLIRNMGQSGQGGAATINHVDEHQLGPAVARAGMALRDFSKNTLVPTVADVGKKLGGFGKHQVAPMMARGGAALNDFGKNKLGPAVVGSKAAIDQFGKSKVGPALGQLKENAIKHPIQTGLIGTSTLTLLAPGILSAPFLAVLGFGSSGPLAGSIAAGAQAGVGNIAAGSFLATLQSAGMGGYGVAIVNGVVSAVAGIIGAATGASIVNTGDKASAKLHGA